MGLEIINLNKIFKNKNSEKRILNDINLTIGDGEFVCILGHSGCGKTTLLNIIAGFVKKTSGSVLFNGKEADYISPERIMLFQESSLFPWLNVIQNIEFGLKMSGLDLNERRARASKILELVNLKGSENLNTHQLSGGMKQRVALARALVLDSEILLMDEPFSALDYFTKNKLRMELLRIWRECAKTILFVTHDVEEAILLADKIVVISSESGKIEKEFNVTVDRNERKENSSLKELASGIKEEFGIVDESDEIN